MKCIPHPYKKDILVILVDDEPWKEIHISIFGKSPQFNLSDNTPVLIGKEFDALEFRMAKKYALRRLVKRNYCSYELSQILEERLVQTETAEKIVHDLTTSGYINDEDWLDHYISSQMGKKQGPKSILRKLHLKGVPEDLIKEKLALHEDRQPQSERILTLLKTKYRTRDLSDYKQKQKVIAALIRKGFDYELILRTIECIR